MNRSLLRLLGILGTVVLVTTGCSERVMPLEARSGLDVRVGGPYLSLSPAEETVHVLERTIPLADDVIVSKVIGTTGGVIEIPTAGLRLTIPPKALEHPTEISVKAHAGKLVAYSFQPHGTRFARVLTADQSLAGTLADGSDVRVSTRGYFSDPASIDWSSNRAEVTEVSLVREIGMPGEIQFYLNHFSGYLIAID